MRTSRGVERPSASQRRRHGFHLWIRADARPEAGLGHVMRMMALQEAAGARALGVTMFVEPGAAAAIAAARGSDVREPRRDWPPDVTRGDVVVLDGYSFAQKDVDLLTDAGARVMIVDDVGTRDLEVDVVLNQNPVPGGTYQRARRALLGPRFALVRSEFLERRRPRGDTLATMVVTLGGGVLPPVTTDVLAALDAMTPDFAVRLVVGPQHDRPLPYAPPWLEVVAAPDDVTAAFDADAAISAAGSTTWELLAMGVPTLLVQTADNQEHVIRGATAAGAALGAGAADAGVAARLDAALLELIDPDQRASLSRAALALVDGRGAERVVDELLGSN